MYNYYYSTALEKLQVVPGILLILYKVFFSIIAMYTKGGGSFWKRGYLVGGFAPQEGFV
jgi:hypothetical protein